jgi:hypothetical protein
VNYWCNAQKLKYGVEVGCHPVNASKFAFMAFIGTKALIDSKNATTSLKGRFRPKLITYLNLERM